MRNARRNAEGGDSAGEDSFLDIVANIVGILILLVMVVGVRAARRPAATGDNRPEQAAAATSQGPSSPTESSSTEPDDPEATETRPEVEIASQANQAERQANQAESRIDEAERRANEVERRAALAKRETKELVVRALQARKEIAEQDSLRVHLAAFVKQTEIELAEKREELADNQRAEYDSRVAIAAAQRRLDELARRQAAQVAEESPVETIENLPTPLAKTVEDNEFFVVLTEGRVAVLPFDALRDQLRARLGGAPLSFRGRDSVSYVVGPVGGFRLRFVAQRVQVLTGLGGRVATRQWSEIIPSEDLIAEPIDQALQEGSALMTSLAAHRPHDTTITAMTYADSFNEFRILKKRLYELGYPVAGRPLPVGKPILASPQGTRSQAQ